jgi:hypothetical protein
MQPFRKIDGHREPPGLEREVLKKLPMYVAGGTFVPALVAAFSRLFPPADFVPAEIAKQIRFIDYMALGAVFTVWTAALTVVIGCVVVIVMKGPIYMADSYPMEDPDHPDRYQSADSDSKQINRVDP